MARSLRLLKTRVQNEPGISKIKRIEFEGFCEPVRMGVHGGFSEFFGIDPDEPLPSTLDYVVAAVSGCLMGTLSAALQKRGVSVEPGKLVAEAEGHLEEVQGKLRLTKISVCYRLKVPGDKRSAAERALEFHDSACPVSESVRNGITIQWTSEIEED
jgi:uncharacterized OsmC-like protein